MKKAFLIVFLSVMLVTGMSLNLQAQQAKKDNPCTQDIKKFCKDVKPGGGRIVQCLKQHESELSQQCKDYQTGLKEKAAAGARDCKADTAKFCKDVKPGGGRIVQCLKQHESELSEACRKHLTKK